MGRFGQDERGQTSVEYALVLALVVALTIASGALMVEVIVPHLTAAVDAVVG